jgi:hypothetical protein
MHRFCHWILGTYVSYSQISRTNAFEQLRISAAAIPFVFSKYHASTLQSFELLICFILLCYVIRGHLDLLLRRGNPNVPGLVLMTSQMA